MSSLTQHRRVKASKHNALVYLTLARLQFAVRLVIELELGRCCHTDILITVHASVVHWAVVGSTDMDKGLIGCDARPRVACRWRC